MVIAFFGHSNYLRRSEDKRVILDILESKLHCSPCDFYLGEYGGFDNLAYECARSYKDRSPTSKLIFVTPYLSESYQKNHLAYQEKRFDLILYPEIEKLPLKFAITYRNKWIVEHADIIITYVTHRYGGAYKMYEYAKRRGKEPLNISGVPID